MREEQWYIAMGYRPTNVYLSFYEYFATVITYMLSLTVPEKDRDLFISRPFSQSDGKSFAAHALPCHGQALIGGANPPLISLTLLFLLGCSSDLESLRRRFSYELLLSSAMSFLARNLSAPGTLRLQDLGCSSSASELQSFSEVSLESSLPFSSLEDLDIVYNLPGIKWRSLSHDYRKTNNCRSSSASNYTPKSNYYGNTKWTKLIIYKSNLSIDKPRQGVLLQDVCSWGDLPRRKNENGLLSVLLRSSIIYGEMYS